MKKSLLALAVLAALTPLHSNAQTAAAPAAEPASPLTGNLAIVSDYRFRGISQSYRLPAVQGGIDYAHSSGFYLGNWNSSVSGNQYPNGASLEMDFYGGFKIPLADAITLDLGATCEMGASRLPDSDGRDYLRAVFSLGLTGTW